MRCKYYILLVLVLILSSCSKGGLYLKQQAMLLEGKKVQVSSHGLQAGYVQMYKSNEQAALAKKLNESFERLKRNGDIVLLCENSEDNFRKVADALKILDEKKIAIFVKAEDIVFGIKPGNGVYVLKDDYAQAQQLCGL